jgi:hypothetical protein
MTDSIEYLYQQQETKNSDVVTFSLACNCSWDKGTIELVISLTKQSATTAKFEE